MGEQKYNEWKNKISNSVKSNPERQKKAKTSIEKQRQTKSWPKYQSKKAQSQHLRCFLKKGLLAEELKKN